MDANRGIGKSNRLPWRLSADLKHFAGLTKGGTVVMGRKTWDSLPNAYRPLKERLNMVMTRNPAELERPEGVLAVSSIEDALTKAEQLKPEGNVFLIGGAQLFQQLIGHPQCTELILTELKETFDCDTFFPEIPQNFKRMKESVWLEENDLTYRFVIYTISRSSGQWSEP